MNYILQLSAPHKISIVEAPSDIEEVGQSFARAYARAKLVAGWPMEPNVREVPDHEQRLLLTRLGLFP